MKYKGYEAKAEFDETAGLIHGEVINIRDVITFAAKDADRLEEEFHNSVDEYLAFCAERSEEPEPPLTEEHNLSVRPDVWLKLEDAAKKAGRPIQDFAQEILTTASEASLSAGFVMSPPWSRPAAPPGTRERA